MPYFRDIIVIGHKGEYSLSSENDNNTIERLLKHIKYLMYEAKQSHSTLDTKYQNDCITRLVFCEFSLYPKKPFSLTDYKKIIAGIADYAKQFPPHIHLMIGTLPVIWAMDELKYKVMHNVGLYVQCGNDFQIHHIDKNIANTADLDYRSKNLYGSIYPNKHGFLDENYYDTYSSPQFLLKDTAIRINDVNQYYGALKLKIFEEEVVVVNEICFEHFYGLGLFYVDKLITQLKKLNQNVPIYASHILISDTIELKTEMLIGPVVHADPKSYTLGSAKKIITKPFFGNSTSLYYQEPRKIEKMYTNNLLKISTKNFWKISFPLKCDMNFLEIEEINQYRYVEGKTPTFKNKTSLNELMKFLIVNNDYLKFKEYLDLFTKYPTYNHFFDLTQLDHFPLRWAARLGHIELVKLLLASPIVDPTAGNNYCFRWACANGHTEIVEILLANKQINPDAGTYNGLVLACRNGHTQIVKLLLNDTRVDPQANVNEAFLYALQNGNLEIVKAFYNKKIFVANENQLKLTVKNGHLNIIKFVLEGGNKWPEYSIGILLEYAYKCQQFQIEAFLRTILFVKKSIKLHCYATLFQEAVLLPEVEHNEAIAKTQSLHSSV